MFVLADCNNFYASCERVFQPRLNQQPIVVLSNNDGCVIARSNEAKALDIAMGDPFFKIKPLCQEKRVAVFSSNYSLYGDMSQRVMCSLEYFCENIEFYSIDEAFLQFEGLSTHSILASCEEMQKTIEKWTGIPISVGIGPTKTLAKLASYMAKKQLQQRVYALVSSDSEDYLFSQIPISEVWGIGRRWSARLNAQGITTVLQLKRTSPEKLRQQYGVVLERTCLELNGISCLELALKEPRKNIVSSRSFGVKQIHYRPISQALANYVARACEKMRGQGSVTKNINVFLSTNLFNQKKQYQNSLSCELPYETDNTSLITYHAKQCLKLIFKEGYEYQKTGIMLLDLKPKSMIQYDLFSQPESQNQIKTKQLMQTIDAINQRMGKNSLFIASQGTKRQWEMKNNYCSPCYTTRWSDLVKVK